MPQKRRGQEVKLTIVGYLQPIYIYRLTIVMCLEIPLLTLWNGVVAVGVKLSKVIVSKATGSIGVDEVIKTLVEKTCGE